ncbi:DUF2243 domain-containing protein [Bacillus shivajii]|uniref:DUF2243 domain-containing protein n=1 Tax=Bacillus shivajii TaxID=1983719 RepID=UPI001CFA35C8|nr:DUF2243 domain-containing protein [Bacillus shivajii]UCZ53278.1 DUF2243 domain-containing protein [Bacillus shivajii]
MKRWIAFLVGVLFVDFFFHSGHSFAFGFKAETLIERLSALLFVLVITLFFYYICYKFFARSFFNGVIFASGFFASFDIIVVHWIFQLHRLTYGPEALIIEVLLVLVGVAMIIYAMMQEKREWKSV